MFDHSVLSNLRHELDSLLNDNPVVFGSAIGLAFRKHLTIEQIKEAGGVVQIVLSEFSDMVERIPGKGPVRLQERAARTGSPNSNVWTAFVHQDDPNKLFLDAATSILSISSGPCPDLIEIGKLSTAEVLGICREFLVTQSLEVQSKLEETLSAQQPWKAWAGEMVRLNLYKAWIEFRKAAVDRLLEGRLQRVGTTDVGAVIRNFRTSSDSTIRRPDSKGHGRTYAASHYPAVSYRPRQAQHWRSISADSDREIVERIVAQMTNEELSSLWVPLRAVIAANRK